MKFCGLFLTDHPLIRYRAYSIIIIMTHRQLWSVATTLHGVHVPPHSVTSVSSWLGFPRRPAVSMSSGDAQEVFASSYQGNDQRAVRSAKNQYFRQLKKWHIFIREE